MKLEFFFFNFIPHKFFHVIFGFYFLIANHGSIIRNRPKNWKYNHGSIIRRYRRPSLHWCMATAAIGFLLINKLLYVYFSEDICECVVGNS